MVARIVEAVEPHVQWHGRANRELRSCPNALQWLLKQHEGDYMAHLREVKERITDVGVLQRFLYISQWVAKSIAFL